MVMERLGAAGLHPDNQGPVQQFAINQARQLLVDAGVKDPGPLTAETPASLPHVEPLSGEALQAELEAQVARYQGFGFARKLNISQGRFKDTVMGLAVPQPEVYRGRFDIPAVVIGSQIPVAEQYQMIGLGYYLGDLRIQDRDAKGYKTPNAPHLVWMQDGKRNLGQPVDKVRLTFSNDERGANVLDGVGLIVARPDVLIDHYIDLPGTQVESDGAPYLRLWYGRPEVRYHFTGHSHPGFGSASCGRI